MGSRDTILVVDNEFDQLEMMKEILERIGFNTLTTDDPLQAVKWVRKKSVGMVLIDLIMPDLDGTELCEQIKRLRPDIHVYAYSGHVHLYPPERLHRAGFDGTINKPATMEEIKAALRRSMNHPAAC